MKVTNHISPIITQRAFFQNPIWEWNLGQFHQPKKEYHIERGKGTPVLIQAKAPVLTNGAPPADKLRLDSYLKPLEQEKVKETALNSPRYKSAMASLVDSGFIIDCFFAKDSPMHPIRL